MRLTLGAATAPDITAVVTSNDPGSVYDPNTMYTTGTLVCPAGQTFDTKTGLCAGVISANPLACPLGVDVTGYGGESGCVCPSGTALDPLTKQCVSGAAAGGANWLSKILGQPVSDTMANTVALGAVALGGVLLVSMAGSGRRR